MKVRSLAIVAVAACCLVHFAAPIARGDIKNWQTGQSIPGTEAITPGPGARLSEWNTDSHNLRYADFSGGLDLQGSQFFRSWLDYALFAQANLTNAYFSFATLTDANLSDAVVVGAYFNHTMGFTK